MSGLEVAALVFFCLLFSSFFAGAEIAILSADWALIVRRAETERSPRPLTEGFLKRPQWFLATTIVGSTLCVVLAVIPSFIWLSARLGPWGPAAALAGAWPLFILFGNVLPKVYARPRANDLALPMLSALRIFLFLLFPVVLPLTVLSLLLKAVLSGGRNLDALWYTRDELKIMLTDPSAQIAFSEDDRHLIDRIFAFNETVVEDVMIPLIEVEAISESATAGEALRRVSNGMYSRYPAFRDRVDNVTGVLRTRDLLDLEDRSASISQIIKSARYVPYNKPIDELLMSMRRDSYDFAVVVDEFGGCVGVITREDVVEEIVGEIEDEHDDHVVLYRRLEDGRLVISARMEIWDLNELFGWDLPEGNYETMGGFLLSLFRRVPRKDERVRYKDLVFTISESNERTITEVLVEEDKEKANGDGRSP